jgi:hypothetical protein
MIDRDRDKASTPPEDLLRELEPVVRRGLDRHLSVATEWFPHDYVPYERGRAPRWR